jgi:uncharacterized protein (DUF305 family)
MSRIFRAALLGFALVGAPAAAQDHSQMDHSNTGQATGEMSAASQAYMDAMAKMDADMKAMAMTGKPGVDFALMMIPHHQSAIDMAKAYIAFMKAWLGKHGQ